MSPRLHTNLHALGSRRLPSVQTLGDGQTRAWPPGVTPTGKQNRPWGIDRTGEMAHDLSWLRSVTTTSPSGRSSTCDEAAPAIRPMSAAAASSI